MAKRGFYFITTPWWLRRLFPGCLWDVRTKEKAIYLTFDDGPHPDITPFVLEELVKYNAKATFFCIGSNVKKFPEVYRRVQQQGHTVGNHTMHHINGWKNSDNAYLADITEAGEYIKTNYFRPPYGRIKRSQIKKLSKGNTALLPLKTIMWSVLAGDWDSTLATEQCFERVKKNIYPGCIVVLHDSEKAYGHLSYVLPKLLKYFTEEGYRFMAL